MLYTWNLLNIVNQLCQSKKKIQMGKKKEMVLGELKRMKLDRYFTFYKKYQLRMDQRNTLKSYIKLRRKHWSKSQWAWIWQLILRCHLTPRPHTTKEKTDKLDLIKIKYFRVYQGTLSRKWKDSLQNGRKSM